MLIIIWFCLASVGTAFALGACTTAKLRNKDDHWNAVVGGMAAGSLFGLRGDPLHSNSTTLHLAGCYNTTWYINVTTPLHI